MRLKKSSGVSVNRTKELPKSSFESRGKASFESINNIKKMRYCLFIVLLSIFVLAAAASEAEAFFDVNLTQPANTTNTTLSSLEFKFKTVSNESNFSCSLYLGKGSLSINKTNSSTDNNTETTFSVSSISEGNYIWNVFCNSTSQPSGNWSAYNKTFTIDSTAPSVILNSQDFTLTNNISLNYTPADSNGIKNCSLYHNMSGTWTKNYTDTTISNNSLNSFQLNNIIDGAYKYNVVCYDYSGNMAYDSANETFEVDYINQNPTITAISDKTMNVGDSLGYQVLASDADGDSLSYAVNDSAVSINASGYITYSSAIAINKSVRVTVSDGRGGSAYEDFTITVIDPGVSISLSKSSISFSEADRQKNYTQTFLIKNNGTQTLNNINVVSAVGSKYNVGFQNVPSTLAVGASQTVTLSVYYPDDLDASNTNIGYFYVTSSEIDSSRVYVSVFGQNELEIRDLDFKGSDDTGEKKDVQDDYDFEMKIYPGNQMEVLLSIHNDFSTSSDYDFELEDIEITFEIEDIDDGDDMEFEKDINWIEAGDTEEISFNFMIPYSVEEDKEYDFEINIDAEDENGAEHKRTFKGTFVGERKNHAIEFIKLSLNPNSVSCDRTVKAEAELINLGSRDEKNVALVIENSELEVFKRFEFDMENEYDEDSNRKFFSYQFTVPDYVESGDYYVYFRVFYEMATEYLRLPVRLDVDDCKAPTSSEDSDEDSKSDDEDDQDKDSDSGQKDEDNKQEDGETSNGIDTGAGNGHSQIINGETQTGIEDITVTRLGDEEDEGFSPLLMVSFMVLNIFIIGGVAAGIIMSRKGTDEWDFDSISSKVASVVAQKEQPAESRRESIRRSAKNAENLLHETIEIIDSEDKKR